MKTIIAVLMLLISASVLAAASQQGCESSGGRANGCNPISVPGSVIPKNTGNWNDVKPVTVSAPEIDMAAGVGAIAVLITAILIAAERRRRVRRRGQADRSH